MDAPPYGIVHFFPGGTKDQYEASIAAVHPRQGLLPDGQVFHAAGTSAGGWTIMAGYWTATVLPSSTRCNCRP
jgi:hypothetical protein